MRIIYATCMNFYQIRLKSCSYVDIQLFLVNVTLFIKLISWEGLFVQRHIFICCFNRSQ